MGAWRHRMTWLLLWLAASIALAIAWGRGLPPKSDRERRHEDEEQAEYLRRWRAEREAAAMRKRP